MEKKNELYYDAMEHLEAGNTNQAKKLLKDALLIDSEFVDAYVGLCALYREIGEFEKEKECADFGYDITKSKFPKWPTRMEWGVMGNRAYMRSICDKATTSRIAGDLKTAEKLYRLLLELNPNDNQGIRYLIAGMLAGKSSNDIDRMFDKGDADQNWDGLEKLVYEQNKIHKSWKEPEKSRSRGRYALEYGFGDKAYLKN